MSGGAVAAVRAFAGLKDLRQLLTWLGKALHTISGSGRGLAAKTLAITMAAGLLPVALSVAMAVLIGSAPGVLRDGADSAAGSRLLWAAIAYTVLLLLQGLATSIQTAMAQRLSRQVDGRLRERVMRAALGPAGIRHLEDPTMRTAMEQARNAAPTTGITPGTIAAVVPASLGYRIRLLGYLVGLTVVSWPVGLAFLLVTLKSQDEMQKAIWRVAGAGGAIAPPAVAYQAELATSPAAARELRVFGLRSWVVDRYRSAMRAHIDGVWDRRRDFTPSLIVTLALTAVLDVVGLLVLGAAAIDGQIGVGAVAFGVVAIMALTPAFNQDDIPLAFASRAVDAIEEAERLAAEAATELPGVASPDGPGPRRIRFEGVSFRYPGAEDDVLRGLDLELRAGERTALVGLNGAGKTTLVKLICRLYDPTEGRILVDGEPLDAMDPSAWRERLAVMFQDHLRLDLTARENVVLAPTGSSWTTTDDDDVVRAAVSAGALEVVARLPHGWDTVLSPEHPSGVGLSGGEWQRVALARALHRLRSGGRVLVLDEPAASLDVRAEAALYDRLVHAGGDEPAASADVTTLLISHRFATVRQADRILVLSDGCIVEDGTHEDLLDAHHLYARMFRAQAEHFADGDADGDGESDHG